MLSMLLKTKIVKGWFQEDKNDMDVDTTTSGTQTIAKHPLHARARDLLLIFLIDQKRYNEVTWLIRSRSFLFYPFSPPESLWFLTLLLVSVKLKFVPWLALFD